MINIRPVSDLRNKFPEIEETVIESNEPVFLTKNGYGTMVLLSSVCSTKPLQKSRTALDTRGERLRCFEFDEMTGI